MNQTQIFISYQSDDYPFACKIYEALLSDRYWVWIDKKKLEPAREWERQIDENLRRSKTLIALMSSNSVASEWVKHEGSMAYALNQLIIPVNIEPSKKYSAANLPIWAAKIQLLDLIDGGPDFDDQFQKLKQALGEPLPIRQHIKEMLFHYKNSGVLLDEVALALAIRHYDELFLTREEQELADRLIEESKRKLENYWERYDKLKEDYENAKVTISTLSDKFDNKVVLHNRELESLNRKIAAGDRIQFALFISVFISIACWTLSFFINLISR